MARIGIVTTWFERGAAYVSRAFRDALEQAGHTVFIYARGGEVAPRGNPRWDNPSVHWAQRLHATTIDWAEFQKWHSEKQIDLVIFNEQQDHDPVARCKNHKMKTLAYVDFYTPKTVDSFRDYTGLICCTKRHFSVFKDFSHSRLIPWGTDTDLFKPRPKSDFHSEVVFYHSAGLGGVLFRKGTPTLIEAFSKLSAKNTKLVISSQRALSQYPPEMQTKVQSDNRIVFRAETIPHPGNYHYGDIYVYPTKLEGIGLTIAEALACGLPVITTNNGPMNEFVTHDVNGKLIRVDNFQRRVDSYYWDESVPSVTHLSELMGQYVSDPSQIRKHGIAARESAEVHFNWNKNRVGLLNLVDEVMAL